jgi:predicted house-cleaning noncanonical NTP pyrophosphatase (MazG superfamily)
MSQIGRVYYNKLVRDSIPDIISAKQEHCEVRTITDQNEFEQELLKKVKEEAGSLAMARSKAEFLEEYADLMMVLETITDELKITPEEIETACTQNRLKKGGYTKRHFLLWSDDVNYKSNETPQGIPR